MFCIRFQFKGTNYEMVATLSSDVGVTRAVDLARTIKSNPNFENVTLTEDTPRQLSLGGE